MIAIPALARGIRRNGNIVEGQPLLGIGASEQADRRSIHRACQVQYEGVHTEKQLASLSYGSGLPDACFSGQIDPQTHSHAFELT